MSGECFCPIGLGYRFHRHPCGRVGQIDDSGGTAWPTARSEAACWLNEDCIRGYHGVMDEDGCQYRGKGPEVVRNGARSDSGAPGEGLSACESHRGACPRPADLLCHCGEPVWMGYDDDQKHHRGMCGHCDPVRCDANPGACDR